MTLQYDAQVQAVGLQIHHNCNRTRGTTAQNAGKHSTIGSSLPPPDGLGINLLLMGMTMVLDGCTPDEADKFTEAVNNLYSLGTTRTNVNCSSASFVDLLSGDTLPICGPGAEVRAVFLPCRAESSPSRAHLWLG